MQRDSALSHQEDGLRGGTESVAGVTGFAKAVELSLEELPSEAERLRELRDNFRQAIAERFEGIRFNTPEVGSAPHILSVSLEGVEGESLLNRLDHAGVAVST